jgi:hypothetical protein
MSRLILDLPDDIAATLAQLSEQAHRLPEDLAREMLQRALAVERLDAIRRDIQRSLGDDAPPTDEDVFKQIS